MGGALRQGRASRPAWFGGAAAVVLLLAAPVLAQGTFTNPIKALQGADPWLAWYDGAYYLATTTWDAYLTMRTAPTLAALSEAEDEIVWRGDGPARCCNMWAPEFHLLDGPDGRRWYLYYVAGRDVKDYNPTQRLHVLESEGTDPMGPYHFKADLLPDRWALDPSVLQLDGKLYLLGSYLDGGQSLFLAPMANPWTLAGDPVTISHPTFGWETSGAPVEEGPEALQHDGRTFLVFSASGCWTSDYKLGMLAFLGGDPLDPASWHKALDPVFRGSADDRVFSPGHNGFFSSPDGSQSWIVYHASAVRGSHCDNTRSTRAQPFTWNADGTPDFGVPVATGVPLPEPSAAP